MINRGHQPIQNNGIMKYLLLTIAIALAAFSATARDLAVFNLNSFDGWIYTRENVNLTTEYIGANKVRIFRNSAGKDFTLISPAIDCSALTTVRVRVGWQSPTCNEDKYNLTKNSPYIELIDLNGNVVAQHYYLLPDIYPLHDLDILLPVPEGSNMLKVRFAAWDADLNSPGAISNAIVSDFNIGDVNADGQVNVSDVTQLISVILGEISLSKQFTDINGDGNVNVSDVTALINRILGVQ